MINKSAKPAAAARPLPTGKAGPVVAASFDPATLATLTAAELDALMATRRAAHNAARAAAKPASNKRERVSVSRDDAAALKAAGWAIPAATAGPVVIEARPIKLGKNGLPKACKAGNFYDDAALLLDAGLPVSLAVLARVWATDPASPAKGGKVRPAASMLQTIASRMGRTLTVDGLAVTAG